MSDERPTRPSRPSASVPTFRVAPASRPFALVSNTLGAVDRILRRHVEESAAFVVDQVPLIVVASRESDLVRLVVRLVADAALLLGVPRAPDASIRISCSVHAEHVALTVITRGIREDGGNRSADTHPTMRALAVAAKAVMSTETEQAERRVTALVPLATTT